MANLRKPAFIIGGLFVGTSMALTGYIAGTYMGIGVQARLADIANGINLEQDPEVLKAAQVIVPILIGLFGVCLTIGGVIKGSENLVGPGMVVAGLSLTAFSITAGIAQTIEHATTQQIEAIAISAGVIAALAIAAFVSLPFLPDRRRVHYEKVV